MLAKLFHTVHALLMTGVVSFLVSVFVGMLVLFTFEPPAREQIPRALVDARLGEEASVATALGFEPELEEDVRGRGPIVRPFSLRAGECIAALAGFHGGSVPEGLVIVPRGAAHGSARAPSALAAQLSVEGVVAHVQWCAERDTEVDVVIFVAAIGGDARTLVWLMRAATAVGLTSADLVRGRVLVDASSVLDALEAQDASDAGPPGSAPPDAGLLDAGPPDSGPPDAAPSRGRRRSRAR